MAKKKKLIIAKPRLKKATRKKPLLKKKSSLKPKKIVTKKVARPIPKKTVKIVRKKPANQLAMGGQEQFLPKSFFKAKIRVIGIGGGGGSIVSEIGRSLHKASFVVSNIDT